MWVLIMEIGRARHYNTFRQVIIYYWNRKDGCKNIYPTFFKKIQKSSFFRFGAGNVSGTFKFTLLGRDDSSNFLLSETQASELGLKQVEVEVVTLNEFLPSNVSQVPDIIKNDAEGFDLEVLEGANNFFGQTEILYC